MTTPGSKDKETLPLTSPPSSVGYRVGVMPRPDQPGALHFDNINIMEFLHRWNIECEDFDLEEPK